MSMKIGIISLNKTYSLKDPSEEVIVVDAAFNNGNGETLIIFSNVGVMGEDDRRCLTIEEFSKRAVWDDTNTGEYEVK